jgi:hypothetical protein
MMGWAVSPRRLEVLGLARLSMRGILALRIEVVSCRTRWPALLVAFAADPELFQIVRELGPPRVLRDLGLPIEV